MRILCDTNIIIRSLKPDDPSHQVAKKALTQLVEQGHELVLVPQCIYEIYVVSTRPIENNGLGIDPTDAIRDIREFITIFRLLRDERSIFDLWLNLVSDFDITGKPAHDARLVAAMMRHGVKHILTFNESDFKRYPDITTLPPSIVVT